MGSRNKELVMSGTVVVSKEGNEIKVRQNTYKNPIKISPKIPSPDVINKNGIKNLKIVFEERTNEYSFSLREMNYEISSDKIRQSGQAYSLYFEINDDEDITYLEGNIIPFDKKNGALFLSLNVSPKDQRNIDLFALPIVIPYKEEFLNIVKDLRNIIEKIKDGQSEKRVRIYKKIQTLLVKLPEVYSSHQNKLDEINNMTLKMKVTLMDFNFTCCLENALSLSDCVLSVPDIEEICAECPLLIDCLGACFDFLTLPACLLCFSLDVLACAYCIYKAGECTEDALKVIDCCK